jgi:hypothetical protein
VIRARDVPSNHWATAVFRWAGARSAIVTGDGRDPVLLTAGSITCGRLFLRCKTIPIELGAGKNGSLVFGERVFIDTGATVVATHSIVVGDDCLIGAWWPSSTLTSIPWNRPVQSALHQFVLVPTFGSVVLRRSFPA